MFLNQDEFTMQSFDETNLGLAVVSFLSQLLVLGHLEAKRKTLFIHELDEATLGVLSEEGKTNSSEMKTRLALALA